MYLLVFVIGPLGPCAAHDIESGASSVVGGHDCYHTSAVNGCARQSPCRSFLQASTAKMAGSAVTVSGPCVRWCSAWCLHV